MRQRWLDFIIAVVTVSITVLGSHAAWTGPKKCGKSLYDDAGELMAPLSRIVGGDNARQAEFPYQVRLFFPPNAHFCGGALLNKKWVLTAAHCVTGGWWYSWGVSDFQKEMRLRVGDHDRFNPPAYSLTRKAKLIIVHPDWVSTGNLNDIALIKMNRRVNWANGSIRPVCPPDPDDSYAGNTTIASGWGYLEHGGSLSAILQYVSLVVITNDECKIRIPNGDTDIKDYMVCASDGATDDDRDACQGDSGGPLVVKNDRGRFVLIGLVSWGYGCASGYPGVYTRVGDYVTWVGDQMAAN